jgi:hypothetical protein
MREMRSLGFTERETTLAVLELMRKMKEPVPPGQVLGLELAKDPVIATLMLEDDYGGRTLIQRSATELAASLVNYCLERKIRLPTSGRKFVEVIAGELHLVIFIDPGVGKAKLSRPSRRPTV